MTMLPNERSDIRSAGHLSISVEKQTELPI